MMRHHVFGALAAAVLWFSPALAQDEPVPQGVGQAYLDYQAALQAGDAVALLEAGQRAFEAGEAAEIDRAVLATLSENYGFAASLNGDYERAKNAWREAGRLSDSANVDPVERAWRWHNAALVALQLSDMYDAYACSRNAQLALDDLGGELGDAASFAGDALLTRALTAMRHGRIDDSGVAAAQAAAAFETVLDEPNLNYGLALLYAGVAQTLDQDFETATYSLHMAQDVLRDVDPDNGNLPTLRAALTSARLELNHDDEEETRAALARLHDALDANPYHAALYSNARDDDPDGEADNGDEVCCDAVPVQRRTPRYPENAAYSDLDGVVYLRFTVTETGETENIELVGSFPPGVFDDASIRAVRRWRYEPATRDGIPVRREGVETRFDFRMQD